MNVLHLDVAREWRGGQVQLALLARHAPGHGVVVSADSPLARALSAAGVPCHPASGLRGLVVSLRPDVLVAHTSDAHSLALAVAATLPFRCPVVVHRRVDFTVGKGLFGPLKRVKYRRAAGFVAVSEAVKTVLIEGGVDGSRVRVVPDAVEPGPWLVPVDRAAARALLGVPSEARWVAAVGALVPHKGHATLIDALAQVPDAYVTVAGDGPLAGPLLDQARARGVLDRFRLLGARTDVAAWLGGADVFCHPSHEEGLGQSVIEAMLAGVPVVATTAGGIPETVGRDGVLVAAGDARALAAALGGSLVPSRPAHTRLLARHHPAQCAAATLEAYRALSSPTSR